MLIIAIPVYIPVFRTTPALGVYSVVIPYVVTAIAELLVGLLVTFYRAMH